MNTQELIEQLEQLPQDLPVMTWDDGSMTLVPLTDLAEVKIGIYGHNLSDTDEGTPAVMLLAEQRIDEIMD